MSTAPTTPATITPANVQHQLPLVIVVLPSDIAANASDAIASVRAVTVTDAASLKMKDRAFSALRAIRKEIEDARVAAKAPVLRLGEAIDAEVKPHLKAIDAEIQNAKNDIQVWNDAEAKRHAEVVRLAKEKADREQKELDEKFRLAQIAREEEISKQRAIEEAAKVRTAQAAAALAELMGTPVEPVAAPVQAKVIEPPPVQRVVVKPVTVEKPVLSKSVTTRVDKVCRIVDPKLIPHELGGEVLREYKEAAITRVLKNGFAVPGCELIDRPSNMSIGGVA